jgi:hypothetical protein
MRSGVLALFTSVMVAVAMSPVTHGQTPPAQGQPPAAGAGGPGRGPAPAPQNLKVLPKTWTRQQVQTLMQTFVTSLGQAPPAPGAPPPAQGQGEGCLHCHVRSAPAGAPAPGAAAAGAAATPAAGAVATAPAAAPGAVAQAPAAGGAPQGPPPGGRGPQVDYVSDTNPNKEVARKMIQMVMAANDGYLKDVGDPGVAEKVSCWTCHRGESAKPPMMPAEGWGRGGFSLLPAGPPMPAGRGRGL